MSLYNMMFGINKAAPMVLAVLGLKPDDFPRFRDAMFMEESIVVRTRAGGGNREEYQGDLDGLSQHPLWLKDEDDDFDSTYCDIHFSYPPGLLEELKKEAPDAIETETFRERFDKVLEKLKDGPKS
jgi:hypothetical protein